MGAIHEPPAFVLSMPRISVKLQNSVLLEHHNNDQHEVSSAPFPV
jgi:hypothetical protein